MQDYASGLVIGTYRGLPTVDHNGGDAGYRSDMTRFPEQHFSASVLCNFADTNPSALVRKVADIVLVKDLKPIPAAAAKNSSNAAPTPPLTADQMNAIAGNYWDGEDQFAKVIIKDGKLLLDVNRDDWHELIQFAPAHFHVAGEPWGDQIDLHFIAAEAGRLRSPEAGKPRSPEADKPRSMEQSFDGGKPEHFQLVDPAPLTAAQLADCAGDYVSEEIDPVYRMVIQNGQIVLTRPKSGPDALRPAISDVFVGDIGKIRFTRDAAGHVSGFILDAGRIQNFRFTKKKS
jgi:hypothetical protein